MAQRPTADFNIDPNVTSGTDLANILNRFQDAIDSGNSGASRPAYLDAGGLWVQTGNPMRLFFYDGIKDVELFNTNDGVIGIDDGTEVGQVTTWSGSAWAPDNTLIIKGGDATFSGDLSAKRVAFEGGSNATNVISITGASLATNIRPIGAFYVEGRGGYQCSATGLVPTDGAGSTNAAFGYDVGSQGFPWANGYFSGKVTANQFEDANGPIISAFTMVEAFRKIKNAVADETTVEGIKESLTNVLGGLIEEFESIGTQES